MTSAKPTTPRTRQLLRQAERVAEAGKRLAARQLYEEVLQEEPSTVEAWLGLAKFSQTPAEQEQALITLLSYDPLHQEARTMLAALGAEEVLSGLPPLPPLPPPDPTPAPAAPTAELPTNNRPSSPMAESASPRRQPLPTTTPTQEPAPPKPAKPKPAVNSFTKPNDTVYCYRHPTTETSLRCNRCGNPICIKCANRTSVGYRCPDCLYELEEKYYTGQNSDYIIATAVTTPLSLLAGFLLTLIGFSIWILFFVFLIGGAVGSATARITFNLIGRRRSRYMPQLVGGIVFAGAIAMPLALFLISLGAGFFDPWLLVLPFAYGFIAASSAYYYLR